MTFKTAQLKNKNMETGYIKLHRSLLSWEWYDDQPTKVLFFHLLLTVNWEDKKWHGRIIRTGQIVTSYLKLSKSVKLSLQQTRTALNRLKSTYEITCKSTRKFTIITVCNWKKYQLVQHASNIQKSSSGVETSKNNIQSNTNSTYKSKRENSKQSTHNQHTEQQTNNIQLTTTKEGKEYKEERKYIKEKFGEVVRLIENEYSALCEKYSKEIIDSKIDDINNYCLSHNKSYKDYAATIRSWLKNDNIASKVDWSQFKDDGEIAKFLKKHPEHHEQARNEKPTAYHLTGFIT